MAEPLIEIEIAYAAVDWQRVFCLSLPVGTTLAEALRLEEVRGHFPELNIPQMIVGIFGKVVDSPSAYTLQQGERIEIYRPLVADPKEIRKLRAAKAAAQRAGTKKPG